MKGKRLCCNSVVSSEGHEYYVRGFSINYPSSQFLGSATSLATNAVPSQSPTSTTNRQPMAINSSDSIATVSRDEIAERCRIAISGNGGMIAIEGHCTTTAVRFNKTQ